MTMQLKKTELIGICEGCSLDPETCSKNSSDCENAAYEAAMESMADARREAVLCA
jgi:hypothetical protein